MTLGSRRISPGHPDGDGTGRGPGGHDPVAQAHHQGHVVFDDQEGDAQGLEFLH